MVTIMNRRQQYSPAPPALPSRAGEGVTHVKVGYQQNQSQSKTIVRSQSDARHAPPPSRSQSEQAPPPPPINTMHKSHSTEERMYHQAPRDRKFSLPGDSGPPPPPRDNQLGIGRRAIETGSFIDRNTARAFSSGGANKTMPRLRSTDEERRPPLPNRETGPGQPITSNKFSPRRASVDEPPPPPVSRPPPNRQQHTPAQHPAPVPSRQPKIQQSREESLPARPPKIPTQISAEKNDLESRFHFHDPSEFPDPDLMEEFHKRYMSLKQKKGSDDMERLGPL